MRCDVALVGIGVEPAGELLPARAPGVPVFACGDVTGRVGHWTSAADEAVAVARQILGLPPRTVQPAFFWSDQFGLRLQLVGHPAATAVVELDGGEEDFLARIRMTTVGSSPRSGRIDQRKSRASGASLRSRRSCSVIGRNHLSAKSR